jgi:hypothetical protein
VFFSDTRPSEMNAESGGAAGLDEPAFFSDTRPSKKNAEWRVRRRSDERGYFE